MRQAPMAIKSAVYTAVRDRLVASRLPDKEFAEVISTELNHPVTTHMVTYYRTVCNIIPHQTRMAVERREAAVVAARERDRQREVDRTARRTKAMRPREHADVHDVHDIDDLVDIQEALRTHSLQMNDHLEMRLAERCRVFDVATKNLWAKLDEHEKLANKNTERVRILEGRVTRIELQIRASNGSLPNGWKVVDAAGNEIERVETQPAQANGAGR